MCSRPQSEGTPVIQQQDVKDALRRLESIWPVLRNRREQVKEIGDGLWRHRARLTPASMAKGIDLLLETTPAIGYPPGPSEVIGCVLMAAGKPEQRKEPERELPRTEVVGRQCEQCGSPVELFPPERVLICVGCNTLQKVSTLTGQPRYYLSWAEVRDISTRNVGTPGDSGNAHTVIAMLKARQPAVEEE